MGVTDDSSRTELKLYGRARVSDLLGDRVVYRSLKPFDPRLPGLEEARRKTGIPPGPVPRKHEPDYARAMAHILRAARRLDAPGSSLKRLIFIGDTLLSDGGAFHNLCEAGGWGGLAFIGSELAEPSKVEVVQQGYGQALVKANRWSALEEFERLLRSQSFYIDESTAVVLDLDKTTIGARGRNSHVIDAARLQAIAEIVSTLEREVYDEDIFNEAYQRLNHPEFHPFTVDNQDYLTYICLIVAGRLFKLEHLIEAVREKNTITFEQFITQVHSRRGELAGGLAQIHEEIYANVKAGDPTPFKAFRRREYLATISRMGWMEDTESAEAMLEKEIVITHEVRSAALEWKRQGALLFGLSDKPDESSAPTLELSLQGFLPLHCQEMHAIGG